MAATVEYAAGVLTNTPPLVVGKVVKVTVETASQALPAGVRAGMLSPFFRPSDGHKSPQSSIPHGGAIGFGVALGEIVVVVAVTEQPLIVIVATGVQMVLKILFSKPAVEFVMGSH